MRTVGWMVARARLFVGVTIVATLAACSGAGNNVAPAPASIVEPPRDGGTVAIGGSEPQCADWYSPCGGLGGFRIMGLQTLPTPVEFVDGQYRSTSLLVGEPTLEPGPPQRVTYRINPLAVWSDGAPITSSDFKYSWEQAKAASFGGMGDIASVDDSDPRTAIATWTGPSATWRDRFQPLVPKHLLEGKDRNAEMKDGYRFSGGPWMIDHWTRGQEIKLVHNPRWWGAPPHLDAVVLKVVPDVTANIQAYKTGQVDMIFVPSAEPGALDLRNRPDTGFEVAPNPGYSFFAMNTQKPPFDRKAVRQALAYATDRDAIVTQLQGQLRPGSRPTQALTSQGSPEWYTEPFARYHRDLSRVAALMSGDGWSKGPDGVWVRGDVRARIELSLTAGVQFFALVGQIVESEWKEAGFDVAIKAVAGLALFDLVPKGNYQVVFTGVTPATTNPEQCSRFCSKSIPTDASRFQGGNITRISSPVLDDIWGRVDTELDQVKRRDLVRQGQEALADEMPALPLASQLDVFVFNTTKIGGPVSSTPSFLRLSDWFCRSSCG